MSSLIPKDSSPNGRYLATPSPNAGKSAGPVSVKSSWVPRTLWLIAGALAAAVLSVRSENILGDSKNMVDRFKQGATLAFAVPAVQRNVPHSLDALIWAQHAPVLIRPGTLTMIPADTSLTINGWAFDPVANAPFAGIGAKIDTRPDVYYAIANLSRSDVAAALQNIHASESGFSSTIDTSGVPPGRHTLALRALTADNKNSVDLGTVEFDIQSQAMALQKTDSIDAINGIVVDSSASVNAPTAILRSAKKLTLDGWGFISDGQRLAKSMTLLVDGAPAALVRYGVPRPDVASAYHDARVTLSGYEATLSLRALPAGVHEIRLRMNLSDGTAVDSMSVLRFILRDYL